MPRKQQTIASLRAALEQIRLIVDDERNNMQPLIHLKPELTRILDNALGGPAQ